LYGNFFHEPFQLTDETGEIGRGQFEVNKWCAVLVVKTPNAEPIQRKASERALIFIFRISVTVDESKIKVRSETFQFKVIGLIRSKIAKGFSMISLETRGIGWKLGKVGIQGDNQISRELETQGE